MNAPTEYQHMRLDAMKKWHDAGVPAAEIRRRIKAKDEESRARVAKARANEAK